jgi:hypothetical protein
MSTYKATRDPDPYPAGRYDGHFYDYEERQGEFGPYLIWTFRVHCNGETQDITGITASRFGSRSKEFQYVEALQGRSPGDGEDIDLEKLRGAPCKVEVTVKEGRNGGQFNVVVGVQPADPSADALDIPEEKIPF